MLIKIRDFKYILYATLFSFIVFGLIIPAIQGSISHLNPYFQFIIFNVGIFIFLNLFLKSILEGDHLHLRESFGLLFLFMALDLTAPPLAVATSGVLNSTALLSGAGSDYIIGSFLISLGVSGFFVYALTYIAVPFLFFVISAILLKNLVKRI